MPNILMPALSPTMEEGKLAKWVKKTGDTVKSGDVIAEIETDKATMEVEAVDEGTLAQILVPEGTENVKVNTPIAVIAGEGEEASPAPSPVSSTTIPRRERTETEAKEKTTRLDIPPAAAQKEAVAAPPPPDLEVPEGTEMVTMTVREALRQAMSEEMRRDPAVF